MGATAKTGYFSHVLIFAPAAADLKLPKKLQRCLVLSKYEHCDDLQSDDLQSAIGTHSDNISYVSKPQISSECGISLHLRPDISSLCIRRLLINFSVNFRFHGVQTKYVVCCNIQPTQCTKLNMLWGEEVGVGVGERLSLKVATLNKCSAVAEMGDRLATIVMCRKWGAVHLLEKGATFPCDTMWPGSRPTFVPSGILMHPTV